MLIHPDYFELVINPTDVVVRAKSLASNHRHSMIFIYKDSDEDINVCLDMHLRGRQSCVPLDNEGYPIISPEYLCYPNSNNQKRFQPIDFSIAHWPIAPGGVALNLVYGSVTVPVVILTPKGAVLNRGAMLEGKPLTYIGKEGDAI